METLTGPIADDGVLWCRGCLQLDSGGMRSQLLLAVVGAMQAVADGTTTLGDLMVALTPGGR
jgi:hypothetical protein